MRFKSNFYLATAVALIVVWLTPSVSWSLSPAERGRQIAVEADKKDAGFTDSVSAVTMVLTNRQNQTATRALRIRVQEVNASDRGDRSLIVFDQPRDVAGTALLTHSKVIDPSDQWIYLPALRRVKRISSANQSGPFMGSEFAYEDLSAPHVDRYGYKYLRDETLDGKPCFVIERTPLYENSGYTRQVLWVDQEHYRNQKIQFFDRKGDLLKTLTFSDYQLHKERIWRAHELAMVNHQTGKGTRLTYSGYTFGTGLTDRDFNQSALKRVR
jgi:outer membrane lipoprotein-sorting protein